MIHLVTWKVLKRNRKAVCLLFPLSFLCIIIIIIIIIIISPMQNIYDYVLIPLGVMLQAECASFCGFCNKISHAVIYIKIMVFWFMTACCVLHKYQSFQVTWLLYYADSFQNTVVFMCVIVGTADLTDVLQGAFQVILPCFRRMFLM